jgi:hypothetical protein
VGRVPPLIPFFPLPLPTFSTLPKVGIFPSEPEKAIAPQAAVGRDGDGFPFPSICLGRTNDKGSSLLSVSSQL